MDPLTVVSIWSDRDGSNSFLGSGCLLDRRHVLTARHLVAARGAVYLGLIPGAAERYSAHVLASHDEHDAAILMIEAETPMPVASPVVMRDHQSLTGEAVQLLAISPLSKSRYAASSYSIGNYDDVHGEYELSPDDARGHSGGVVIWDDMIVGLLFARASDDPLCRAVSMHRLYPWILRSAPTLALRDSKSSPASNLSVTWSGSVESEFPEMIVIRPATVNGGGLEVTNRGLGSEKIARMALAIAVMREVPDGMSIPVAAFKFVPVFGDPLGRVWTETQPGHMTFEGPVVVRRGETWQLPELMLEWNEEDIDSRRKVSRLVGLASLFIQLRISIFAESQDVSVSMNIPLRVIDGEETSGDGGVESLVEALQPASEAARNELIRRYTDARGMTAQIWQVAHTNQANAYEAQRLEDLADELADLEDEVAQRPSEPEPLLKIAGRYISENLPRTAARVLDHAWELGLHEARQHLEFADMQITLGNRERALASINNVRDPEADSARYFGLKAEALDDEESLSDALFNYEQAIAREPSSSRWHQGRGLALTGFDDRLDEAVTELDLAIELGANGGLLHAMRATIFANQEKYEEALAACRKAIALGNSNLSTFDNIANHMPVGPRRELLGMLRDTIGAERAATQENAEKGI